MKAKIKFTKGLFGEFEPEIQAYLETAAPFDLPGMPQAGIYINLFAFIDKSLPANILEWIQNGDYFEIERVTILGPDLVEVLL